MYAVNSLSIYAAAPSAVDFQYFNNLICYLAGFSRHIIMYPSGIVRAAIYELFLEVSLGNFCYQNISNVLFAFTDEGEVRVYNDKFLIT